MDIIEDLIYSLGISAGAFTSSSILFLIIFILIIRFFIKWKKYTHHSNWNTLIPDFSHSSEGFYELLSKAILNHGVNKISLERVIFLEGSTMASATRKYQRIKYDNHTIDVCAAPFGNDYFVSWWCLTHRTMAEILVSIIPLVGERLHRFFYKPTYYKVDTASMFMTVTHHATLNVIEEITKETGFTLSEGAKTPRITELIAR